MNSFLIIGAGRFGKHLAINLCRAGHEVMLVDNNQKNIDELWNDVTTAEIGAYTIEDNLEALGVEDYDHVFVCITDFRASLNIVAKAGSQTHEKFLYKTGADSVIYPEREVAATMAVEYSYEAIYDYLKLDSDVGIYEIKIPKSWEGKTPSTLNIRQRHGVTIIATKSSGKTVPLQSADYVFSRDEHILVMGSESDIKKLK